MTQCLLLLFLQIIAEYEEHNGPSAPQGGDGTSGSSIGSTSPDIFHANRKLPIPPQSIPSKTLNSTQGAGSRSSPAIPNNVRSSPAIHNSDNNRIYNGAKIEVNQRPSQSSHQPPQPYRQRTEGGASDYKTTAFNVNLRPVPDKPSGFPKVLRNQPERATPPVSLNTQDNRATPPILNNIVDKRLSVEVTEQDLSTGDKLIHYQLL